MDLEDENDKIDEYILKCLVKSGWYMGRSVDVSCYDDVLKEEGYVINKHAYDILKEWGGLYIRNFADENYNAVDINFDPIYYASGEIDRLKEFEESAGSDNYRLIS